MAEISEVLDVDSDSTEKKALQPLSAPKTVLGSLTVPKEESIAQQLVSPRAVYKNHDPHDLVSLAKEVQQADAFVQATTANKLQVILDQIRHLQQQAQKVLETAKQDAQLHHAACNFVKVPGKIYHLYEKPNGSTYFSMLSEEDWGGQPPNKYLGSYRLEHDRSWTAKEQIEDREKDIVAIHKAIFAAAPDLSGLEHMVLANRIES